MHGAVSRCLAVRPPARRRVAPAPCTAGRGLPRRAAVARARRAAGVVFHPHLVHRGAGAGATRFRQGAPHRPHRRRPSRRPLRDDVGRVALRGLPRTRRRVSHGHALSDRRCKDSRGRSAGARRLAPATRAGIGSRGSYPRLALRRALRRVRAGRRRRARGVYRLVFSNTKVQRIPGA